IYSAKTNAFYPVAWKQAYIKAGSWPEDGIEVSEAVYMEFAIHQPPEGKQRVAGHNGYPTWVDIPPPTPKELQQQA
ncbi:tail fiber assembly protein, partial [Xenorhabdus bharatensis]|uniref:tail fiber assembly protein n=1 Tax=Xenorhabdus bharatensis TaxID=3136256 RepID=UPI003BF5518D